MPQPTVHPLWASLAPDRKSGIPLQEQIMLFFRSAIADGRVHGGQRVPSSRQLAKECSVSRTTAVEVYQRLVAEGYFVTRPGAGVFVAEPLPRSAAQRRRTPVPVADPPNFTRVDMRNYLLPLAPGMPAIDRFPWSTWARLTSQICRERPQNAVGYGDPQGELPLRRAIADYLATTRGILCDAGQILVMAGSVQSFAYVLGQVAAAGDSVWVEEPCGSYLRDMPREVGLVPVSVDVDDEGLDVEQGRRKAPGARVAVVSPTHQYPTGTTMSLERRKGLVDWCESSGAWILESEIDGDYRYTPHMVPPIFALSSAQRVFYCGSLSKPLAPGLRTNYLVVPPSLVNQVSLTATLVPMLTQLVLARFSDAGHLALHMRKMRALYARRRGALLDALRAQVSEYLVVPHVPDTGLRVVATFQQPIDDVRLANRCLAAGIKVDPLSTCYADRRRSGLIIGFASTPEERIPDAVATLRVALRRELDL